MITNKLRQFDPSRTLVLRRQYGRDYRRRWQAAATAVRDTITPGVFQSGGYLYAPTAEGKVKNLTGWLDEIIADKVTGDGLWQRPYIRAGYLRGIKNAHADLRKSGRQIDEKPEEITRRVTHAPTLNAFYGRAERDLQRVRRAVVETAGERFNGRLLGLVGNEERPEKGEGDEEWLLALLLLLLMNGQQSGAGRSNAIVSTLVVGAAAEAVLNRLAELGISLVAPEIEMLWQTARDSRVCPACQELATRDNGRGPGIYSIEDARGLIPAHPFCRCSWVQTVGGKAR